MSELLSNCCGMPALGEIVSDHAFCSRCKEQALFEEQSEEEEQRDIKAEKSRDYDKQDRDNQ